MTPEAVTGFRQRWRTRFAGDPGKSLVYRDIGNGVLPPGIEYYLPLFFEQTATLADYLSAGTRVVLVGDVQTAMQYGVSSLGVYVNRACGLHEGDALAPAHARNGRGPSRDEA